MVRAIAIAGSVSSVTAADSPAVGGVIGFAILAITALGILVRIVVVIFRRRKGGIRRDVLGPIAGSGGVQSELYGYRPSGPDDLASQQQDADADRPERRS